MMHKAWSNIEEVPYCFSMSSDKFRGHTGQKITNFDPNWSCPDCSYSLNSPMALRWCSKLNVAKKMCPIVFQGYPSNFKVTRDKKTPILTGIWCFRTETLVWDHRWIWNDVQTCWSIEEEPNYLSRSSINCQGHTHWKIDDLNPNWVRLLSQ